MHSFTAWEWRWLHPLSRAWPQQNFYIKVSVLTEFTAIPKALSQVCHSVESLQQLSE